MTTDNRSLATRKRILGYLIAATIFLVPFYFFRFSALGIPTNIFEIAVGLSFLAALWVDAKALKQSAGQFGWWPYLLVLAALVSVLWTTETRDALGIVKGWFIVPIVFGITFNAYRQNRPWPASNASRSDAGWQWALYASATIVAVWGLAQYLGWLGTAFYQQNDPTFSAYILERRAFGPFESPNYLAMFLAPTFFLTMPLLTTSKKLWAKIVAGIGSFLMLEAVADSQSQGGSLAIMAGLLCIGILLWPRQKKTIDMRWAGVLAAVVIVLNVVYFAVLPYVDTTGGDSIRQEITHYSLRMIRENPLWGVGLGSFQDAITSVSAGNGAFQTYALPFALHPHNLALALWLNLGLAGLIIFAILVWQITKKLIAMPNGAYYLAALAAILTHGIFDTTYFKNDLSAVFWLIFSLSLSAKNGQEIVKPQS